ncbi:dynein regulatory complex protein 10 [Kryptolebias marmoratus]|uniref:dynein regulatory complex protein 10 n=1 Tax=Kryptolebias marmoratus TaxID=37003 RepID=UPI0007F8CF61|nr:dynein regulatory complex protein 10 [Kryptolebias marmoratus]
MSAEEATAETIQSEDASLSPQEKLSPEAERISRVLENCIRQVEIVAFLPSVLQFDSESGVLDQDLSRVLRAHQDSEERLEKLEGLKQRREAKEEKRKRVQLKENVKNSVRDVLRFFRNHPDVLLGLRVELNVEVGESESMLIRTLQMFHSHVVENLLPGLDEFPREVLQNQPSSSFVQSLGCMMSQEENVNETLKQLEEKLEQLEKEILKKGSEIESFQRYLNRPAEQKQERQPLREHQDELNMMASSSKLTSLHQEVDQLNAQLNSLMLANRQAQRILLEKNENLEMEIESLFQTFDKDIEKIQTELEVVENKYENEQEEVRKLQGPFSVLEAQCSQIQERRRLAEEKRKEEIRVLELKTKGAVTIQAWWRGYSVRKALKNKSKSKKGKKGKGKKRK